MDIKFYLTIVIALLNIFLGLFILRKNYKAPGNIYYCGLCISGGIWAIFMAFLYFVNSNQLLEICIKGTYAFAILPPLFYLMFAYHYPYKGWNYPKWLLKLIFTITAVMEIIFKKSDKGILLILISSLIILPFGNVLAYGTNYQYTGQEKDINSNLYYYGQRYYQPEVGRFTQPDPVSKYLNDPQKLKQVTGQDLQKFLENPQALNEYSYTQNNPVKYTDPNGEQIEAAVPVISEGAVVVAAVSTAVAVAVTPIIIKAVEKVGEGIVAMVGSITALFSRSQEDINKKISEQENGPLKEHVEKLNNPNQEGGKDPQTRKDWKKHAEKALNNMKKAAEKMKIKENRIRELERIEKIKQDLDKIPVYIPQTNN